MLVRKERPTCRDMPISSIANSRNETNSLRTPTPAAATERTDRETDLLVLVAKNYQAPITCAREVSAQVPGPKVLHNYRSSYLNRWAPTAIGSCVPFFTPVAIARYCDNAMMLLLHSLPFPVSFLCSVSIILSRDYMIFPACTASEATSWSLTTTLMGEKS